MIVDRISVLAIQTINNAKKRNLHQKRLLFKANDYLYKQNNKRSLLGRKQRSQVIRSFPNRYQFSCINKVTSLFSDRYIFIIILRSE